MPAHAPPSNDPVAQQIDALDGPLPAAHLQWRVDADGAQHIERVSPALWSLLGSAPPASDDPGIHFWERIEPADRPALQQCLQAATPGTDWHLHWRTAGPPPRRTLHGIGRPWQTLAGDRRCRAFVFAEPDLGAAEDRRVSERRFRELIDAIPNVAVQGYDHQLVCRFWNTASEQLYGYCEAEALGASLLDLIIPPGMRHEVIQATATMLATGQAIPAGELVLQHKRGHPVHVHSGHVLLQRPGQAAEFSASISIWVSGARPKQRAASSKRSCARCRKWKHWAHWPVAWHTTSTTSWQLSWAT